MFKLTQGYRMPVAGVDSISIYPATLGGGIVLEVIVAGKREMMIFSTLQSLEQNLFAMFRAASMSMGNAAQAPAGAQVPGLPKGVSAAELGKIQREAAAKPVEKKRAGRPKGAKNKPKLNGAHGGQELPASATGATTPAPEVALS